MRITKVKTHRYSKQDIEKLDITLGLLSNAINSVEFKRSIEQHEQFDTLEKYSTLKIYQIIMSGNEVDTNDGIDHEADLHLTLDLRKSTDAIGYTKNERIFTFQNFFSQLEVTKLAGHIGHEYCHTLGFADPSDLSDLSKNVPYEVGRIIEEISINNQRIFFIDEEEANNEEITTNTVRKTARNSKIVSTTSTKTKSTKPKIKNTTIKKKKAAKKKNTTKKRIQQH